MIDTCFEERKSDFRCLGKPAVSRVVQELAVITGNVLILCFNFTNVLRRKCCSLSENDYLCFCAVDEFGIDEGSESVVYTRVRDPKGLYPFHPGRHSGWRTSVFNWWYHLEAKKHRSTKDKKVFYYFVNEGVHCGWYRSCGLERSHFAIVPRDFHSCVCSLVWFFLTGETISVEGQYPVKRTKPLLESFRISVGFWTYHILTLFVKVSEPKTRLENVVNCLSEGSL